ncbi:MAG: FeoB-associated Cys-rich membrane protein [Clostridiales bacterium]|nr:FeoB-associated Cys-rich membrane protein [Clostridiales bacterium]
MTISTILNLLIPAAILLYVAFLLRHMIKTRKNGPACGGCAGCPMSGNCTKDQLNEHLQEESPKNE